MRVNTLSRNIDKHYVPPPARFIPCCVRVRIVVRRRFKIRFVTANLSSSPRDRTRRAMCTNHRVHDRVMRCNRLNRGKYCDKLKNDDYLDDRNTIPYTKVYTLANISFL